MTSLAEKQTQSQNAWTISKIHDAVISTTPDLVYLFALDGRFLYANNALLKMWGKTYQQAIGKSLEELGYEKWHAEMHLREIDEVIRTQSAIKGEVPFSGTQGRRIYEYIFTPVFDEKGAVSAIAGTTRDVTERKALEDMLLKARQDSEVANNAKTDFLSNMSHEIRTPMNAIVGLSHILALSKPLTPKQREFVITLQSSADALLSLINDLLDIAKIEARTVKLEVVPFNLARILQEVANMMDVRVKEKGLTLTNNDVSIKNRKFLGDGVRIRQIMLNLYSNAIKFTDAGFIEVSVACEKTQDSDIENVLIVVKDSGIGIAHDHLDYIFGKFTQADSRINRKYGGTGLGLAIAKNLVECMGGTIHVESVLGEGSAFKVCLPLQVAANDNTQANITEPFLERGDNKTGKRILLLEEHEPNMIMSTIFLEQLGYQVDIARSGAEAVKKFNSSFYSAILMNVPMHELNDFEAIKLIRGYERNNNLPRIPIIGMTGHSLLGDREHCLSSGMDEYVSKPFNSLHLEEVIRNAIALAEDNYVSKTNTNKKI